MPLSKPELWKLIQHYPMPTPPAKSKWWQGQASDFDIHAREILRVRERLNQLMVKHTGRSMDQVKEDTDRDNFMDGDEAKNFGLIDQVIEKRV